jgi:hypothetical protein
LQSGFRHRIWKTSVNPRQHNKRVKAVLALQTKTVVPPLIGHTRPRRRYDEEYRAAPLWLWFMKAKKLALSEQRVYA